MAMAVTSGFFSSVNGDRKYSAEQLCALFDGFITDGVMQTVGTVFQVEALSGRVVTVDTGRAWFDNTWIHNDAKITIDVPTADVLLNRWDAIVIEVNKGIDTRADEIKIVSGTPASTPAKPAMVKTAEIIQYPIAYIYSAAGSETVTDANITMNVGTESCPYAGFLNQSKWIADEQAIFEAFMTELHEEISADQIARYAARVEAVDEEVESLADTVDGFDDRVSALETKTQNVVNSVAGRSGNVNLTAADIGAGTLKGRTVANANAEQNLGNAQVRNVTISDTDIQAGIDSLATGEMYVVYT